MTVLHILGFYVTYSSSFSSSAINGHFVVKEEDGVLEKLQTDELVGYSAIGHETGWRLSGCWRVDKPV